MKQLDREKVREVTENIKKILDRLQKTGPNGKIQFQSLTDDKFDQSYYELNQQRDILRGLIENSQNLERAQVSFTSAPKQKIDQKYIQVRYVHFAINHFPIIDSKPSMLCGATQPSPDFTPPFGQIVVTKYEGSPILSMVGIKHSPNIYQMFFVAKFKGHFFSPAHDISFFPVCYPSWHSEEVEHAIGSQVYFVINTETKETAELKQGFVQKRPMEHNSQMYTITDAEGNTYEIESRFVAPISSPYEYNEELEKTAAAIKRPVIKPVKPPKPIQSCVPKPKPVEHVKHPKIKIVSTEPPKPKVRSPRKLTEAQKVAQAINQASESRITSFNFLALNKADNPNMEEYNLSHPVIHEPDGGIKIENPEDNSEGAQQESGHDQSPEQESVLPPIKSIIHRVEVKSCVAVTPVVINKIVKPKEQHSMQHTPRDSSAEDIFSLLNNHTPSTNQFLAQQPTLVEQNQVSTLQKENSEEIINRVPSIEYIINPVKTINLKVETRSTITRTEKDIPEKIIQNEEESKIENAPEVITPQSTEDVASLTDENDTKTLEIINDIPQTDQNALPINDDNEEASEMKALELSNENSKPDILIHTQRNPGSLKIQLKLSKVTPNQ